MELEYPQATLPRIRGGIDLDDDGKARRSGTQDPSPPPQLLHACMDDIPILLARSLLIFADNNLILPCRSIRCAISRG